MKKVRILSLLSVAALATTVLVTAPTVAAAAPLCDAWVHRQPHLWGG